MHGWGREPPSWTVRRVFATGSSPPPLHRRGRPPDASRADSRLLREFIPPSAPYSPTARQDIHIGLVHTSAQRDQYLQPPSSLGCCLVHGVLFTFTLARKSEISFHMKCEVKVKVKSIRCFHVNCEITNPARNTRWRARGPRRPARHAN